MRSHEPLALDGTLLRPGIGVLPRRPFPGYVQLVGESADGVTFFVGSILFTFGGALQSWLAWASRRSPGGGLAAWWAAIVQSAGTLFFNVTTYQAMHNALSSPDYDKLGWRPDWRGSICFLVSGAIAYLASPRRGWRPIRGEAGWWQPAVNLLGCVFFGISAVAGYVVPSTGSMLDLAAANWNTSLGAVCFLACALDTLHTGRTSKTPHAPASARSSTSSRPRSGACSDQASSSSFSRAKSSRSSCSA
jgi:hypothetical protein